MGFGIGALGRAEVLELLGWSSLHGEGGEGAEMLGAQK